MRTDRRERSSSAPECCSSPENGDEQRSPSFYATRRDVVLLVTALTALDSVAKAIVVALS